METLMLKVEAISCERNANVLFADVSIELYRGACFGIVGRNGSGKSTLLDCLFGGAPLRSGDIQMRSGGQMRRIRSWSTAKRSSRGMRRLYQKSPLLPRRSAGELIGVVGENRSAHSARHRESEASQTELELFLLSLSGKVDEYSFGQSRAFLLALVLASAGSILLLDEPFEGMSQDLRRMARAAIQSQARSGAAIILVDHDLPSVRALSDDVLELAPPKRDTL